HIWRYIYINTTLPNVLSPPSKSCDSGVPIPSKSCDSGVPIPSKSCDSGVPNTTPPNHVIQVFQTLHCQTYCPRPPNHVIQVFQSPPWPQVYTIKPLGMQTASTNIGERMGRSQELSDSKRGPVIGGHLGNKSIRDISWLLNIPRSTVSGIITKWKQLGTTATQPPSGRPRHMTGRG
ncbi:unnamed protein product, partial [Staurois parvus]